MGGYVPLAGARAEAPLVPGETPDDRRYVTQLNQARAVRFEIERRRSMWSRCSGPVGRQLDGCSPAASWPAASRDGHRRPLWYALHRAYAERLLTIQPRDDGALALVAVNDSCSRWDEHLAVTRRGVTGDRLAGTAVTLAVPPRTVATVPLPTAVATPGDPRTELLAAGAGPGRALWFFVDDVDLVQPPVGYRARVVPTPGRYLVTVTAKTLLRDLVIYVDQLDPAAEIDDALVTLLPGESVTFKVRSLARLDTVALTTSPVLRCAGQLRRRTARAA